MKEENERLYGYNVDHTLRIVLALVVLWALAPFMGAYGSETEKQLIEVDKEVNTISLVGKKDTKTYAFTIN
jgi:hypothetical protein